MNENPAILITGCAGFLGFHIAQDLLSHGHSVCGIDNLCDYYDVDLKRARLEILSKADGFRFIKADIADRAAMTLLFGSESPSYVVHMAAQAGVRYSIDNPDAFVRSNLVGFVNILEGCRSVGVAHLLFASSSSVYGLNSEMPFSTNHTVDHPVSLYGATKKANELIAHSYAHLYDLPSTGLRFFTVYGPFGRPDMAYFEFARKILADETIELYNNGEMERDFTYVDDVVRSVSDLILRPPSRDGSWDSMSPNLATSSAPYRIYNVGNNNPVGLRDFVECLEAAIGKKASVSLMPMQPGDVVSTYADVDELSRDIGFAPSTPLQTGIDEFIKWYRSYYRT